MGRDQDRVRREQRHFHPRRTGRRHFFSVVKGKVKLSVVSKQGKETVIAGPQHVLFHVLPEAMGPSAGEA